MAGSWTDPRTWVDGETPTGAQFNTQIRDNLKYLKDTPTLDGSLVVGGSINATNITASGNLSVAGATNVQNLDATNIGATGNFTVLGSSQIGDALADTVNIVGLVIGAPLRNYTETVVALGGTSVSLDCAQGTYFVLGLAAAATYTFAIANPPPSMRALGITLIMQNQIGGGIGYTWPATVIWPSGQPPTPTQVYGKWDVVTLVTYNGGAIWFGVVVGQGY